MPFTIPEPIKVPGTIDYSESGRTIADVLLPDGTNVNHELVKEGWCWWYRKYAPGDTMLEGLEAEARDGSWFTRVSPVGRTTFLLLRDISSHWNKNRIIPCIKRVAIRMAGDSRMTSKAPSILIEVTGCPLSVETPLIRDVNGLSILSEDCKRQEESVVRHGGSRHFH